MDKSRDCPIVTEIFYPADHKAKTEIPQSVWKREPEARDALLSTEKDKYPLILFSHGYDLSILISQGQLIQDSRPID